MSKFKAALVKYEEPGRSVSRAVELCGGLDAVSPRDKVFIKPNIVMWTKQTLFPKFGMITTSRVIEDVVRLLKDKGVNDITIGEGVVVRRPKDKDTPAHAFDYLGYSKLKERYGVKYYSIFERPFVETDLGGGVVLNYNADALESDFVVNVPVMKTHSQTVVSLGIKNLKGLIDINSRKLCHNADRERDLHYHVARLADRLPPSLTLIDGIFTLERGPSFDGKARRFDALVASNDVFSADLVGTRLLGQNPDEVKHLVHAAAVRGRQLDLSDIEVVGEKIEDLAQPHMALPMYNEEGTLPLPMAKMGIEGLYYRKYDDTLCTYCSGLQIVILSALAMAWKGEPWDDLEVLTGKNVKPSPGHKHTLLLGQCMYDLNKDDPNINDLIAVKGCPPVPTLVPKAFAQAGVELDPAMFEAIDMLPGFFNRKYEGKPEFDENFFRVA